MLILYKSRKLEKSLTEPKELSKTYGVMAKKVNQRMKELQAAKSLLIIRTIPAANCHELKGDRVGQLAVDISGNWRMIFEADHNPIPVKDDGGLNWEAVSNIRILEVEDYHKK